MRWDRETLLRATGTDGPLSNGVILEVDISMRGHDWLVTYDAIARVITGHAVIMRATLEKGLEA